jgi:hypothetical protein
MMILIRADSLLSSSNVAGYRDFFPRLKIRTLVSSPGYQNARSKRVDKLMQSPSERNRDDEGANEREKQRDSMFAAGGADDLHWL